MRLKYFVFCLVLSISLIGGAAVCTAAAAAELVVEVLDNSGAPIDGAAVSVTGIGFDRQSQTDEAGYAFFLKVPKIFVDVTVESEGFTQENAVVDMRLNRSREIKVILTQVVGLEELLQL